MDIEVGSNLYRNSNGIIDIEGVPQFEVAIKEPARALLVNFALFDDVGRMMAKVVDSNLTFNERRAYQLAKSPTSVSLKHEESGTVVFTLELKRETGLCSAGVPSTRSRGIAWTCRKPNGGSIRNASAAKTRTQREGRCSSDSAVRVFRPSTLVRSSSMTRSSVRWQCARPSDPPRPYLHPVARL